MVSLVYAHTNAGDFAVLLVLEEPNFLLRKTRGLWEREVCKSTTPDMGHDVSM
jgi:hypothetical protein